MKHLPPALLDSACLRSTRARVSCASVNEKAFGVQRAEMLEVRAADVKKLRGRMTFVLCRV